jgi:hypothetical protein
MPKIQRERLPREKWAHLRARAKERKICEGDLFDLAERKAQDPDVPDGDGQKDFGGRLPSTFLMAGQAARGTRLIVGSSRPAPSGGRSPSWQDQNRRMAPQGSPENLGALDAKPDTIVLDGGERRLGNAAQPGQFILAIPL